MAVVQAILSLVFCTATELRQGPTASCAKGASVPSLCSKVTTNPRRH